MLIEMWRSMQKKSFYLILLATRHTKLKKQNKKVSTKNRFASDDLRNCGFVFR